MKQLIFATIVCLLSGHGRVNAIEPVPEKLVVLTFDDSVRSHFTVARPILKRYGFSATFFITEGFDFNVNKQDYMTWEEIAQLSKDGFEIGNHTRDHLGITADRVQDLEEQLGAIDLQCKRFGMPKPVSFAYPGNSAPLEALPELARLGIKFARRGGQPEFPYEQGRGFAYEPGLDHPLLIPSAGDARPAWTMKDFQRAVHQARRGRIAVLQFHGVPDKAHPWVHTSSEQFESYMKYLADGGYQVVALRDLAKYVDPSVVPRNANEVIEDRKRALSENKSRDNFRRPKESELRSWLENMVVYHHFAVPEVCAATGLSAEEVVVAMKRFGLQPSPGPRSKSDQLMVLPYPGGRHPRIGFLDGAMRPQRETKVSVFAPWENGGYAVVDVPEAIWVNRSEGRELLYLAHTHVPTMWSRQGIDMDPLEWAAEADDVLSVERELPNKVKFGARVMPVGNAVRMELWITNGTDATLSGLRVQNCVMLKAMPEFNALSNENKRLQNPYVACRNAKGDRWVITAWEHCQRPWANEHCPCMHSDPQFPDCEPGATERLQGWISFYEGNDIDGEIRRIEATGWRPSAS